MSINYKVVKMAQPGVQGGGNYKYYARISKRNLYSFDDLCKDIAKMSTFSEADIVGAVTAFIKLIPQRLKEGYSVDLHDLGIMSVYIHSEGKNTRKEVSSRDIKEVKIHFLPGKKIKKEIRNAKFSKLS